MLLNDLNRISSCLVTMIRHASSNAFLVVVNAQCILKQFGNLFRSNRFARAAVSYLKKSVMQSLSIHTYNDPRLDPLTIMV